MMDPCGSSNLDLVRRKQGPGDSHRESQCTSPGVRFLGGVALEDPPQEGGAPEVGWIGRMFGALQGLQAAPPTRGECAQVLHRDVGWPKACKLLLLPGGISPSV